MYVLFSGREIDTVFSAELQNIKKIRLYNFQDIIVVEYRNNIPSEVFLYEANFKLSDFIFFVSSLNKSGHDIKCELHSIHFSPVIGFVFIILAFIALFYINHRYRDDFGCFSVGVFFIVFLFGVLFLTIYPDFMGTYHS